MNLHKLLAFNPFRGKVHGPEDALALEVGSQLRAWALEGRLRGTFTHIPHEIGGKGPAAKVRLAMAKAMGLIAGSGDYVFAAKGFGGYIELKSDVGRLNDAQKLFKQWCDETQCPYAVCRTLYEVKATLMRWGLLT